MTKKSYPTKKTLEGLWWYRLGKILAGLIIVLSLLAPSLTGRGLWYFDGVIGATIWYLIILVLWAIIKYIAYGKAPRSTEVIMERRNRHTRILGILLLIGVYLLIIWAYLST